MQWLGFLLVNAILVVILYVFKQILFPSISDSRWEASKDLPSPPLGPLIAGVFGFFTRGCAALIALISLSAILVLLVGATFIGHSIANPKPGEVQFGFFSSVDTLLTRDFFPIYSGVIFPAVNVTASALNVLIPANNLIAGSIQIVNQEAKSVVFGCELADLPAAVADLARAYGTLMESLLNWIVSIFTASPDLLNLQTPLLDIQSGLGNILPILTCACEILSPIFDTADAVLTSPGLSLFLDGAIQSLLPAFPFDLARILDIYATIVDWISRLIASIVESAVTFEPFGDVLRKNFFEDLTREPKFTLVKEARRRTFVGLGIFLDDVLEGSIKSFYPPLDGDAFARPFTSIGHILAAWSNAINLFFEIILHMDQAFAGKYSGHIQAGLDPISEQLTLAAENWRNSSSVSNTLFGQSSFCVAAGVADGIFGTLESFARAIIGLVRSGREAPFPTARRFTFENDTNYFDFLANSTVRDPLQRGNAGWVEAGECIEDFLGELDPWVALAWRETIHVINATILPFKILIDELPLYDGVSGYFSSGNNISAFKLAVQRAFNESKFAARSYGNIWASLMSADIQDYTQTEYGTLDTTSIGTRIFETDKTQQDFVTRSKLLSTATTTTRTVSFSFFGQQRVVTAPSYSATESYLTGFGSRSRTAIVPSLDAFTLGTGSNTETRVLSTVSTASGTKWGTELHSTAITDIGTDVFQTTATDTRSNMYNTCPSLGDPHNVYYGDTIFDPYPQGGIAYGWCCFGRFVERSLRLVIAVAEVITDTIFHIAAKEGAGDSALRSLGSAFCDDGPGDLNREFIPLLSVMLDDLGCTIFGGLRGIIEELNPSGGEIDLTCPADPSSQLYTKVIAVTYGFQSWFIEALARLLALLLKGISSFISTFETIPGGCPIVSVGGGSQDLCSSAYLDGSLDVTGMCSLIQDYYDATFGGLMEVLLKVIELLDCAFGFGLSAIENILVFFGRGGEFITDIVCGAVELLARIIIMIKMVFSGDTFNAPLVCPDEDSGDPVARAACTKGVVNYMWCRIREWIPFFETVQNVLGGITEAIDAIKCIIEKVGDWSPWDCILSCLWCPRVEDSIFQNIFRDWFGRNCAGTCGSSTAATCCACKFGLSTCFAKKKRVDAKTYPDISHCDRFHNISDPSPLAMMLSDEHYVSCITSEVYTGYIDMLLVNPDFPDVRLVPQNAFYSSGFTIMFLHRVVSALPQIGGLVMDYIFSDIDPFDWSVHNCSLEFNGTQQALEKRICEVSLAYTRVFREWAADGNSTLLGTVINIIGEISHMQQPLDKTIRKRVGSTSSWGKHLAKFDARRTIRQIKRYDPPLSISKSTKKKRSTFKTLSWLRDEAIKSYGGEKLFNGKAVDSGWSLFKYHVDEVLEKKRREVIPGYSSRIKKTLTVPTFDLPPDLLCPLVKVGSSWVAPGDILDLRCGQRSPYWDAFGNEIGECVAVPVPVWEIPQCTTNFTGQQAHCCGFSGCTATDCSGSPCVPVDCVERIRVYGSCTDAQCDTVLDDLYGACCDGISGCSLQTNETCIGIYAGNGTTCADVDLPLACEACRTQSCRRCDLITSVVEEVIQLIIETGVDYFNLFEGAVQGFHGTNFTDSVLPTIDIVEEPTSPIITKIVTWFERIYNRIIGVINSMFDTSISKIAGLEWLGISDALLSSDKENSLSDWLGNLLKCDVHTHSRCSEGKRGVGIIKAVFAVTTLFGIGILIIKKVSPIDFTFLLQFVIVWVWFAFVFMLAFGASPMCLIRAPLLYIPLWWYPGPVIPNCAANQVVTEIFEPLNLECLNRCEVACPAGPFCFPCAWHDDPAPGFNCNQNITNCCDNCPCPTVRDNFERVYPACSEDPFNFRTSSREALFYLRRNFPGLFCILRRSTGFTLTTPGEWDFSSNVPGEVGDCDWTTEEEALRFIENDARWNFCYRANLLLWAPYVLIGLLIIGLVLPLSYYALWATSALLYLLSNYFGRAIGWVSQLVGNRYKMYREAWRKRFQVDNVALRSFKVSKMD